MKYELLNLPFVFIIGDRVRGYWFWTIVSTVIAPGAKAPGHMRFDVGSDVNDAMSTFTSDYANNSAYFAVSYAQSVIAHPTQFGLAAVDADDEYMIQDTLIQHCLRHVIMYGVENKRARLLGLVMFADRNGVTFGKVKRKFDTKDFFLSPSMFRKLYPAQYFMK